MQVFKFQRNALKGGDRMSDIRLISKGKHQLKPLVEAALANEMRLLEAGVRQAKKSLQEFEGKHQMSTQEFISTYENDEIEENLDFDEWIGEFRLLERLREKVETLRGIRFAN
jgi:hypothetical protein